MAELSFSLHEKQREIFESDARFKVVAAGRRGGKTFFAAIMLIIEGLKDYNEYGDSLKNSPVWYVAPTYAQAEQILWKQLKDLAKPLNCKIREKALTLTLPNGRDIVLKGSDNEESLRGVGLGYIVLDEYADMKPDIFDIILLPTLADKRGGALFIGTPKRKNHFYDLYQLGQDTSQEMYRSFTFSSLDNPIITPEEVAAAKQKMTVQAFRQEFEACFNAGGSGAFEEKDFVIIKENQVPTDGTVYMTVDPNGFSEAKNMVASKLRRLDETAIVIVKVCESGWYVLDVVHGRWGVRETSIQILRAAQKHRPSVVGIEKGSLKQALMPYMIDQMRRLGVYPNITDVSHGGKKKVDRIIWALQGRFQNGKIKFVEGAWNRHMEEQLLDFPDPLSHDDLPDALAYIDQIAVTVYQDAAVQVDDFEIIDELMGF